MRATIMTLMALAMAACENTREAPWLTAPTSDSHAAYFPLAGTVHGAYDCKDCHSPADNSFKQFDCITCHDGQGSPVPFPLPPPDTIHVNVVAGYVPTASGGISAECLRCHPTGSTTMADHGRFFPVGAGTVHDFACSQCHGIPRQDISIQQCGQCHAATDSMIITAHTKTAIGTDFTTPCGTSPATAANCSVACLGCHAGGNLTTVAGHPSFSGERLPHKGATCLYCHDYGLRTDLVASPMPGSTTPQPYAVNFATDPKSCWNAGVQQGCCRCHGSPP